MKILVIEDDCDIRHTIKDVLELEGYDVLVAGDGVEGLGMLEQGPDLVLSDIGMPRMDGFELLGRIRENKKHSAVPFVFLTAQTDPKFLERAMKLGANAYISKPFTCKQILSVVESRLEACG